MIGYAREEIMPATQIVRHLSEILNKLKKRKLKKVAIARNNKLESVIIPIEEYELLQEAYDLLEHHDIYHQIKERETLDTGEYITLEEVMEEDGTL